MKIEDLEKALQYFVIAVPESEEQAKAYFWARKALTALRSTPQPGKPLTLDQLREMDGQPVWVVCLKKEKYIAPPIGWRILEKSFSGSFGVWNGENCLSQRSYGSDWLAYPYPPAHIDRSKWISVKERLPDFGIPVLICWDGYTDIAEYWCGMVCPKWRTQHYGTVNLTSVTHWMPLPEPPEEG